MTGLRIGWLAAPRRIIDATTKLQVGHEEFLKNKLGREWGRLFVNQFRDPHVLNFFLAVENTRRAKSRAVPAVLRSMLR